MNWKVKLSNYKNRLNNKKYVFKIPENVLSLIEEATLTNKLLYNSYYKLFLIPEELKELMKTGAYQFNPKGWTIHTIEYAISSFDDKINKINKEKEIFMEKIYGSEDKEKNNKV